MTNQLNFHKDFSWFIGKFDSNTMHRHYAIQLSIPIKSDLILNTKEGQISTNVPILIKSNVPHQILSVKEHFLLLVNPISSIGHYWNGQTTEPIQPLKEAQVIQLAEIVNDVSMTDLTKTERILDTLSSCQSYCDEQLNQGDNRVDKAFRFLEQNYERVVPVAEIAAHCNLSVGRFLHLFKDETGITYRRAQLWLRILKGIPLTGKYTLTEIAHLTGFSDSAHFSRTFRENFGFSPKEIYKISRFIQV
ncbi:AraC family transcriptional regulator [Robertkochia solimangrovi]|uniref:AraC family transcriptional regulator n=1 Tax=Robertkochia solimangrovi TaxID=2213046 RepID=UPI00117CBFBE|nr:AraC family transcriptional regulator [Robertkochia solimangrovi]TRZ42246.1 hypothetical protein DMZ48_14555 [Robertkochia solimangrovi]